MIQDFISYPDWKAPGEDSATVIWPEPNILIQETEKNFQELNAENSVLIQGTPLSELRRRQRSWLNLPTEKPVVATGHQTELFHPGVWAKLAMINAAGARLGAETFLAAVDSDAPKHLNLRWPKWSQPITDDPRLMTAEWSGLLNGPTPGHAQDLIASLTIAAESWGYKPAALDFLEELKKQLMSEPGLSMALIEAMHKLDWSLGLRHQALVMSPTWLSEPYLVFVHHLLARADKFARVYNEALAQFRAAHGIHSPGRPMPDLHLDDTECEIPFWLDGLGAGTRTRAVVKRDASRWKLEISGDAFVLEPGADASVAAKLLHFMRRHDARLSPRALTLTMFLRLLVVDQFVHGIGGGLYDQVNDRVIHRFFNLKPPAFSVTTATLYFPAAVGKQRACLPCLAHEGHRLRHRVLGEEKMAMVRQITGLPRYSSERQQVFNQMHRLLNTAAIAHAGIKKWEEDVAEANRRQAEEASLFDRELFYGIQPRKRLTALIAKYTDRFA